MKKAYLAKDSLFAGEVQKQLSDMTVKYQTKEKELEIAAIKADSNRAACSDGKKNFLSCIFLIGPDCSVSRFAV